MPLNAHRVIREFLDVEIAVELISLGDPQLKDVVKIVKGRLLVRLARQSQPYRHFLAGRNGKAIIGGCLGSGFRRVDSVRLPVNDVIIYGVFYVRRAVRRTK